MPENIPLQQRAGRNIGTEALPPFINGAAMPEIVVNPSGVTVVMVGQEGVVRTPCVRANSLPDELDGPNWGFVINQTDNDLNIDILFVDNENNEMKLGDIVVLAQSLEGLILEYVFAAGAFLGLCPGEKIILRSSIAE
ncbi:MAG: hypothetical protein ACE5F6_00150 [Anaerolineae bacterium]